MALEMHLTNEKTNYLKAPENIISEIKSDGIIKIWHLLPTIIFSFLIVLRVLPEYFEYFNKNLEKNSIVIPITILVTTIPISLINGILIEKILTSNNKDYLEYKESLKEDFFDNKLNF